MNPRRPTPSGPQPETPRVSPRKKRGSLGKDLPLSVVPTAPKLNEFMIWCLEQASRETCDQYVRKLREPLNENNRWSVTAWKKYLRYLCEVRGLTEACEINKKIKSKKSKPDKYVPSTDEVKKVLRIAEEPYRTIYWVLIQSGLRVNEATYLVSNIDRLRKTDLGGYWRVETELERGTKKSWVAYLVTLPPKIMITAESVSKYTQRKGLLPPKYVRKYTATQMVKVGIQTSIVNFIQGRTPRDVLEANYLELVALADQEYTKYKEFLLKEFKEFL